MIAVAAVVVGALAMVVGVVALATGRRGGSAPSLGARWAYDVLHGLRRRDGLVEQSRDLPGYNLDDPAKALVHGWSGGSDLAGKALEALWADLGRLDAAGAPEDEYHRLGDQYASIAARLFAAEVKHGRESAAVRFSLALDAMDELAVVDEENGLR